MTRGAASAPIVVLLHGLGRSAWSMAPLARRLAANGYRPINIGYPSTRQPIETLATEVVLPRVRARLGTAGAVSAGAPLHFVTHSMGGILVRHLLRSAPFLNRGRAVRGGQGGGRDGEGIVPDGEGGGRDREGIVPDEEGVVRGGERVIREGEGIIRGRVVMLGPPNHGSEVVDRLGHWPLFRLINGPAGQQLGTGPASLPNRLGGVATPGFEIGVIAGDRPWFEPFAGLIDGPGDGKVSVASARLDGMTDFIVLPVSHALMMRDARVGAEVLHFLARGRFDHGLAGRPRR